MIQHGSSKLSVACGCTGCKRELNLRRGASYSSDTSGACSSAHARSDPVPNKAHDFRNTGLSSIETDLLTKRKGSRGKGEVLQWACLMRWSVTMNCSAFTEARRIRQKTSTGSAAFSINTRSHLLAGWSFWSTERKIAVIRTRRESLDWPA